MESLHQLSPSSLHQLLQALWYYFDGSWITDVQRMGYSWELASRSIGLLCQGESIKGGCRAGVGWWREAVERCGGNKKCKRENPLETWGNMCLSFGKSRRVFSNWCERWQFMNDTSKLSWYVMWLFVHSTHFTVLIFSWFVQEVFMCKDIDACIIRKAFAAAGTIVFPSDMQRHLYDGMFRPDAGHTIYNGSCAAFKRWRWNSETSGGPVSYQWLVVG